MIPFRAHHGMCLAFFVGQGYSQGFTAHLQQVLDQMADNPTLVLLEEADVVCSHCPNLDQGVCCTAEKVLRYDSQVLQLCGLQPGQQLSWQDFSSKVKANILVPGLRHTICGDCQWNSLCQSRESWPNF